VGHVLYSRAFLKVMSLIDDVLSPSLLFDFLLKLGFLSLKVTFLVLYFV
jgi:hypothetical protein